MCGTSLFRETKMDKFRNNHLFNRKTKSLNQRVKIENNQEHRTCPKKVECVFKSISWMIIERLFGGDLRGSNKGKQKIYMNYARNASIISSLKLDPFEFINNTAQKKKTV